MKSLEIVICPFRIKNSTKDRPSSAGVSRIIYPLPFKICQQLVHQRMVLHIWTDYAGFNIFVYQRNFGWAEESKCI